MLKQLSSNLGPSFEKLREPLKAFSMSPALHDAAHEDLYWPHARRALCVTSIGHMDMAQKPQAQTQRLPQGYQSCCPARGSAKNIQAYTGRCTSNKGKMMIEFCGYT